MSRIEEIKERINNSLNAQKDAERVAAWEEIDAHAVPDIEFLLSKLEIAEKALELEQEKVEITKNTLFDAQIGLAAAITKNGGKIELSYRDYYDMRKNGKFEFRKFEDSQRDSVILEVRSTNSHR